MVGVCPKSQPTDQEMERYASLKSKYLDIFCSSYIIDVCKNNQYLNGELGTNKKVALIF